MDLSVCIETRAPNLLRIGNTLGRLEGHRCVVMDDWGVDCGAGLQGELCRPLLIGGATRGGNLVFTNQEGLDFRGYPTTSLV